MDLSSDSSAQLRERIAYMGFQAGNENERSQPVSAMWLSAIESADEREGAIQRPSDAWC